MSSENCLPVRVPGATSSERLLSRRTRVVALARTIVFGLLFTGSARIACADGPAWFRQNGGLVSEDAEIALPDDFGDAQAIVWRRDLLPGHSTPCIVGGRVFLTTFDEDEQRLSTVAIDAEDGRTLWSRVAPATRIEATHQVGSPAASTIATDGRRIYVFFGSFGLLCYDFDGQMIWSRPMGPFQDEFGASSSPILVDGNVILNEDHDVGNHLIAIDCETGQTVWKADRDGFTRSYSTPVLWDVDGRAQVIVAGSLRLTAYDPDNGDILWWVNGISRIVDSTPVVMPDRLLIATWTPGGDTSSRISMEPWTDALSNYDRNGDGQIQKTELLPGAVLTRFFRMDVNQNDALEETEWNHHRDVFAAAQNVAMSIRPGGVGNVSETHVDWIVRRGLPTVPSPVVYDGLMYMVKDGGIVTNVDVVTGQRLKQGRSPARGNYYASLVAGDGKVYIVSERGVIVVLRAGREWDVLSTHDFEERIMATPVVADGSMFVRTERTLYRFRKPAP